MTLFRHRRAAAAALCAVALTTGLAACGDDEQSADLSTVCAAQADTVTGFVTMFTTLPEPPEDGAPPPEFAGQVRDSFDANLATPLASLVANAPDEIKDEVDEIAASTRQFRETGDPSTVTSEDFTTLTDTVDAYMQENCTGTKATVEAIDYAYRDLPATLAAGTVRIELKNEGDEAHEIVVLTRNPGVTETFDQILALPDDQLQSKVKFINATSTDPGNTGYLVANLDPGDYIFVCSFGKGTTDDDDVARTEPHFTLGMRQDVKVA